MDEPKGGQLVLIITSTYHSLIKTFLVSRLPHYLLNMHVPDNNTLYTFFRVVLVLALLRILWEAIIFLQVFTSESAEPPVHPECACKKV